MKVNVKFWKTLLRWIKERSQRFFDHNQKKQFLEEAEGIGLCFLVVVGEVPSLKNPFKVLKWALNNPDPFKPCRESARAFARKWKDGSLPEELE
jgi:hypothetical protein